MCIARGLSMRRPIALDAFAIPDMLDGERKAIRSEFMPHPEGASVRIVNEIRYAIRAETAKSAV